ncbi:MAG: hypothetical protein U0U66_03715 [Cytophagaceae bacterium]
MKNNIINKLTIIIESANYKKISDEVMKAVHAFEKSITSNKEIKLSFTHPQDALTKDQLSPESWGEYWTV